MAPNVGTGVIALRRPVADEAVTSALQSPTRALPDGDASLAWLAMSPIRPPELSPDDLSSTDADVQRPLLPDLADLTELQPAPPPEPVTADVPTLPPPPSPETTPVLWPEVTPAPWRVRLALGLSILAAWIGTGAALFVYLHSHHGASTASAPPVPLSNGLYAPSAPTAPTAPSVPSVSPVPPGLPAIPAGNPVLFAPRWGTTVPGDAIASIPGGVEYTVGEVDREQWLVPSAPDTYAHLRVDADVAMARGEQLGDGAGLGCTTRDGSAVIFFYAYSDVVTVHETVGTTSSLLGRYATDAYSPGQANHETMLCDTSVPGSVHVMIAIGSTTVYDQTLSVAGAQWWSAAISLCSCGGPSQATYRGLTESDLPS